MSNYNLNPVEEQEQVNLKSQSLTEKQILSQKAGRTLETKETSKAGNDSEEFSEPSVLSTTGNFWDRVGAQTLVVASLGLLVIGIFALGGLYLSSLFSNSPKVQKAKEQPKSQEKDEQDDIGELKTNSALGSQKADLAKLNASLLAEETKPSATPASAPTPISTPVSSPTSAPTPVSTAQPTLETRTVQTQKPIRTEPAPTPTAQPKIIYKYVPVRTAATATALTQGQKSSASNKAAPSPVHTANRVGDRQKQPPVSQSKPVTGATTSLTAQSTKDNKDPSEAWLAAARVGIYQESSDTTDSNAKGANSTAGVTSVNSQSQTSPGGDTKSAIGGKNLIIGTHATGKLETPLFWTSNSNYQNPQSYLIKLTEDLKNADSTVAIPKNALVVAHLKSIAPEGWLEMSAVAIVIKPSGGSEVASSSNVVEKTLPEGAILVQAKDGTPLRAEYKTVSRNQSESEVVATQVVEGDTEANDYSNRMKALEKALKRNRDYQEFSKAEKQSRNRISNKQDNSPSPTVLTLDKGTSVQIYVNKNLVL